MGIHTHSVTHVSLHVRGDGLYMSSLACQWQWLCSMRLFSLALSVSCALSCDWLSVLRPGVVALCVSYIVDFASGHIMCTRNSLSHDVVRP